MTGIAFLALIAIAYALVESCRETRPPFQLDWFQLITLEQVRISKKARGRGDVDHRGRTRRQRAHA